jgi:hypothetical protein
MTPLAPQSSPTADKLQQLKSNYLDVVGWSNSAPFDQDGHTPWYTYPAIYFLKDFIKPYHKVFEYGCGYSTLFYRRHTSAVCSVEHDEKWLNEILRVDPEANVQHSAYGAPTRDDDLQLIAHFMGQNFDLPISSSRARNIEHGLLNLEFSAYATHICKWGRGYFDIIAIDGMARVLSGFVAAHMVANEGILILDNSDRWQYNALLSHLSRIGFSRIDFHGPGPTTANFARAWTTSIFFRQFPSVNPNKITRSVGEGDV